MAVFKKIEPVGHEPVTRSEPTQPSKPSVIGKSMVVKGRIRSTEEVMIEGKVEGNLNVKHRVIVGKSGVIKADIEASEIVISGRVDGNIKATVKAEILPEGVLNGNIVAQRVVLSEGAIFKGNIDMSIREEKEEKKVEPVTPAPAKDTKEIKDKKDEVKK